MYICVCAARALFIALVSVDNLTGRERKPLTLSSDFIRVAATPNSPDVLGGGHRCRRRCHRRRFAAGRMHVAPGMWHPRRHDDSCRAQNCTVRGNAYVIVPRILRYTCALEPYIYLLYVFARRANTWEWHVAHVQERLTGADARVCCNNNFKSYKFCDS